MSTEKNNDEGDSRPNEWTRLLKGSPEVFNYGRKLTSQMEGQMFQSPQDSEGNNIPTMQGKEGQSQWSCLSFGFICSGMRTTRSSLEKLKVSIFFATSFVGLTQFLLFYSQHLRFVVIEVADFCGHDIPNVMDIMDLYLYGGGESERK